jgi:hypothetical protein
LVADLDSDQFTVRQQAFAELERRAPGAETALRKILEGKLSAEQRRKVAQVLDGLDGERYRAHWVTVALEGIGSPEAQRLLQSLARGAPEARRTQEAAAALERWPRQRSAKP